MGYGATALAEKFFEVEQLDGWKKTVTTIVPTVLIGGLAFLANVNIIAIGVTAAFNILAIGAIISHFSGDDTNTPGTIKSETQTMKAEALQEEKNKEKLT
eukprot:gene2140-4542_t